jgi:hypothetical protein
VKKRQPLPNASAAEIAGFRSLRDRDASAAVTARDNTLLHICDG